jgi:hypothetical protein
VPDVHQATTDTLDPNFVCNVGTADDFLTIAPNTSDNKHAAAHSALTLYTASPPRTPRSHHQQTPSNKSHTHVPYLPVWGNGIEVARWVVREDLIAETMVQRSVQVEDAQEFPSILASSNHHYCPPVAKKRKMRLECDYSVRHSVVEMEGVLSYSEVPL